MFIELKLPERALTSPKFYVASMDEVAGLYLFDTELKAHETAEVYYYYYYANGRTYSHIDEFLALLQNQIRKNNTTNESQITDGSQIMEFE